GLRLFRDRRRLRVRATRLRARGGSCRAVPPRADPVPLAGGVLGAALESAGSRLAAPPLLRATRSKAPSYCRDRRCLCGERALALLARRRLCERRRCAARGVVLPRARGAAWRRTSDGGRALAAGRCVGLDVRDRRRDLTDSGRPDVALARDLSSRQSA